METTNAKRKAVRERIELLERDIRTATEYLANGKHASWHGFRPWFGRKGDLPPHKDWVKHVFLRRREKALAQAEKLLHRLGEQGHTRERDNLAVRRTGATEPYL